MALYPQFDCGIINQLQKKKKVLQANEREQATTALSRLLEGNFFKTQKFTGLSH
jgi:hypothetical protein